MEQRQFFLRDVLTVVFKHIKLIIALPIAVLAVVFLANYIWPPTYESSAKVRLTRGREVSQTDPTVTQSAQELTMVQMTVEDIRSEIEMLHSRDVLRGVVEELGLHQDPDFPYGKGVLNVPFRAARAGLKAVFYGLQLKERPSPLHQAMQELDERLIAEPIRDTHVMRVAVRMGDPDKAHEILEAVLDHYRTHHIAVFANEKSAPFFEQQRQRIEAELEEAQNKLQEFRKSANISLMDTEKELLLAQYAEATRVLSQLAETESVLAGQDLDSAVIQSIASETESTVVREMQLRLLELILESNRVRQSLGPKHPRVQSLQEQVREAQKNLTEAIATTKRMTENKLKTIQARLDELNDTKSRLENLEQEVAILTNQYEFYAEKVEQSRVNDELAKAAISNVRVVSRPSEPTDPVRPNKLLNLVLALIGGIILALALAFFLDYLDHGLKTPEDVDYYVGIPALASFFNRPKQALDPNEAERLAVMVEAGCGSGDSHCIEVTSSVANEDSGAVASALADAFANDPEGRVLLIDFSGGLDRAKNTGMGVTDVLLEQASLDEVFTTGYTLTVVGRGTQAEYPAYLWGSERMRTLMRELQNRYRHILLHVGPVLQSHDALQLAGYADGIVLTIKSDATRREVVARSKLVLKEVEQKIVGAVMTQRRQRIPRAVYRRI